LGVVLFLDRCRCAQCNQRMPPIPGTAIINSCQTRQTLTWADRKAASGGKWTLVPHKFDPAHRERLEHPDRLRLLPPRELLARAGVQEGMVVADIGCGPGFFTLPAAQMVGPAGRIYAIDIHPEMLKAVQEKARRAGLLNIETVKAQESSIPLTDAVADVGLLAFVLHEAVDPGPFAREVVRLLAPGGHLLLLEWKKKQMPSGPPIGDRLTPEAAEGWLASAGLRVMDRFEPNPDHYGLIGQLS
jgi:SAM-dependent methyltransferase